MEPRVEQRVFLVEDMRKMRGLLADLFSSLGFRIVGHATTEAEADLWLEEHRGEWDLAVIDLLLDQGSGMGVIRKCKQPGPGKVVVLSSYATPGVRRHCMGLGADAVFQKNDSRAFIGWCAELGKPAPTP
jgi:DNA-binding NarL/FixJ family response regulator